MYTRASWALIATVVLAIVRAPWPDDWDGVGFVLAVRDFDLAAFHPHFPGYPVYVALSRILGPMSASNALAASLASCIGGGLLVLGVHGCVTSASSRAAAIPWPGLALLASPLVVLSATSVGSDALGLGLIAVGVACIARRAHRGPRALWAGVAMGLALGARPSNLVVVCIATAVALIAPPREAMTRGALTRAALLAIAGFAIAVIPAAAALVFRHGVDELVRLGRAQISGHFVEWGGTAATDANATSRVARLCHAVLVDGLGTEWTLAGVVRGALIALLVARGARSAGERVVIAILVGVASFAAYVVIAQNVTQPRHALPIVSVVMALAARGLVETAGTGVRGVAFAAAMVIAGIAWPTAPLVWRHRREPPPGLAAAEWIRARGPTRDAVLFGGRAARFAEIVGVPSWPRTWMGEVDVTLERLDRLPPRIYLTDEVQFRSRARGRMTWQGTFCRDARLERNAPCVAIYRYYPIE